MRQGLSVALLELSYVDQGSSELEEMFLLSAEIKGPHHYNFKSICCSIAKQCKIHSLPISTNILDTWLDILNCCLIPTKGNFEGNKSPGACTCAQEWGHSSHKGTALWGSDLAFHLDPESKLVRLMWQALLCMEPSCWPQF